MPATFAFDGSGTADNSSVMVLAGIGAPNHVWDRIRKAWLCELRALGLVAWHSTDRLGGHKNEDRRRIPTALLGLLSDLLSGEAQAVAYAINKSDSRCVRATYPAADIPDDHIILVSLCFNGLGISKEDSGKRRTLKVVFDRNEPFIHHLKKYFERGRQEVKRESEAYWPTQVDSIEPAASADTIEIQVADLIAWAIHSRYTHGDSHVDLRAFEVISRILPKLFGAYLDRPTITQIYVQGDTPEVKHILPASAFLRYAQHRRQT